MKVILVGNGYFGSLYRERIRAHEHYELVGIADNELYVNDDHKHLAGINGLTVGLCYDLLAKKVEHDAVVICTPPQYHAELSISALNRGKHVLCMKPGGMSATDVSSIDAAARKNHKRFKVDYTLLRAPEFYYAQDAISWHGIRASYNFSRHVVTPPKQEGALLDLMSHDIALFVSLENVLGEELQLTCSDLGLSATATILDHEGKQYAYFGAAYNATYPKKEMLVRVTPFSDITNPRVDVLWNQNDRYVSVSSQGRSIEMRFTHVPDLITRTLDYFWEDASSDFDFIEPHIQVANILHAMRSSSDNGGIPVKVVV